VLVAGGYYRNNGSGRLDERAVLAAYRPPSPTDGPRLDDVDVPPSGFALATAEIFDPASGTWSDAGTMRYARTGAPATALSDGRIMLVGAADHNVNRLDSRAYTTAEIYDPATDRFTPAGELPGLDRAALQKLGDPKANRIPEETPRPRSPGHLVATADGGAVLIGVAGWWKHVGDVSQSFRFDADGRWSEIGSTFVTAGEPEPVLFYIKGVLDRSTAAAVALPDGRVLVVGGEGPVQRADGGGYGTPTSAAVEAYDPRANAWTKLAALPEVRSGGQALAVADGSVLVFGGWRWSTSGERIDLMTSARFLPAR
jgi:hypothetical protein